MILLNNNMRTKNKNILFINCGDDNMKNIYAIKKLNDMKNIKYPYEMKRMGISIQIEENVYPTSQISELVVETLDIKEKDLSSKKVLDYGTGAGFLAIQLALRGSEVTAVDINPYAIECAKKNAIRNGVIVDFRKSNCLEAITDEKFDIILAGMPWDNEKADNYMEMALFDTDANMKKTLFKKAKEILAENGYILMTYAEFMIQKQPLEEFIGEDIQYCIINEKIINGELHYIIKFWCK